MTYDAFTVKARYIHKTRVPFTVKARNWLCKSDAFNVKACHIQSIFTFARSGVGEARPERVPASPDYIQKR